MWWRRANTLLLRSSFKPPWLPSPIPFSDFSHKKGKAAPLQERRMRDKFRVHAKGGQGGNGCWSYRRSRTDRYGKPDGGNGGRGGDVILECSAAVWDFSNLQHHLNAKRGGHGVSKDMIGTRGSDKVVQVPVGTVIHLVSGEAPSFVENTSTKSLHPWEIPDTDEVEPSEALQYSDNRVSASGLLEKGGSYDSGLHSNAFVEQSARLDYKTSEALGSSEVEGKRYMANYTFHYKSDYGGIKAAEEYDEDKYEVELEIVNEEEDEEEDGEEEEEVQYSVAELTKPGQRIVVAQGGDGGLGNAALRKESKDSRSRKFIKNNDGSAEMATLDDENDSSLTNGLPGSEAVLILELKSIADVGLVGMPNAGKSTLLGAISRAKPSVGHYAFTTLRPNIGNLNYDDFFSVTVADIPGLIKGAHANRGLGHAFLRHIERTKVLAYVVDLAAALDGRKGIPPWEQLRDLVLELEYHQEGLSQRPSLVVANKIDEEGAENVYEELKRRVQGVPIFPACAILEEGIPELKAGLRRLMDGSESQGLYLDNIMID